MRRIVFIFLLWTLYVVPSCTQSDGYGLFDLQITSAKNEIHSVFVILPLDDQNATFKNGEIITDYYLHDSNQVKGNQTIFYNGYNYILFPYCKQEGNQIFSLQSPREILNISSIKRIRFIGNKVISGCLLQSQLTLREVTQLNSKPKISLSSEKKDSKLHALNYTGNIDRQKVNEILNKMHADIMSGTVHCDQSEIQQISSNIITSYKNITPILKPFVILLIKEY